MLFSYLATLTGVWLSQLSLLTNAQQSISTYFMDVNCGKVISTTKNGLGAFEVSLTQSRAYRRGLNCQLVVQARPGHQLMFYFSNFDIKYYSYVRGGTQHSGCIDYITLRDGPTHGSPYVKGFTSGICGISRHRDETVYNSTSQFVTISFHSDLDSYFNAWRTENDGFTLVFTEFHTGTCATDEFKCPRNLKCIKNSVRCNNYNPCGDETDCKGFPHTHHPKTQSGQTTSSTRNGLDVATVIGIVVSVGFLVILLVLVIAVIKTRRFTPRQRRCRRRHNISFIDVESSMTQLRLPSYEEICGGATGPYVAPPPYTEQDPNKSNTSLEGASHSNADVAGTSQSGLTSEETSNTCSTQEEASESDMNGALQTNTTTGQGHIHSNATLVIPHASANSAVISDFASDTDTQTLSSSQMTSAQTPAMAGSTKADTINQTEQNKYETLVSDRDNRGVHRNQENQRP